MTGPAAFSDTPQGSKTGTGHVSHDLEMVPPPLSWRKRMEPFSADAARPWVEDPKQEPPLPQRRTQTVHITLTVDLPGDLRTAADGALRREFPRGKWEVTE